MNLFLISFLLLVLWEKIMHSLFLSFLGFFARLIIKIHKPYVIWVTGTVWKTTISTNIAKYLQGVFGESQVQISPYHYNGEYGLPLSVIGAKSPWKNIFLWTWIFIIALFRCVRPYPKYLVLEYGIDHVWEMEFLLSIAIPDIAIVAPIAPNHLEQFWTLEAYRKEKLFILEWAKKRIVHESLRPYIPYDVIYYGSGSMSDIDASHFQVSLEWVTADVHLYKSTYHLSLPTFWSYQIENILPLYAVGHILSLDVAHISDFSHLFAPEPGRSNILSWIHHSTIVDGSYNGGFESICRGMDSIVPFLTKHPIFCLLWDMRELGDETAPLHKKLAEYITDNIQRDYVVYFFLVWPNMKEFVLPVLDKKYTVFHSLSSREMGEKIHKLVSKKENAGAIIYVKGSQNTIFLEEGIKKFLLSSDDESLLCRQSQDWMRKKEHFFQSLSK